MKTNEGSTSKLLSLTLMRFVKKHCFRRKQDHFLPPSHSLSLSHIHTRFDQELLGFPFGFKLGNLTAIEPNYLYPYCYFQSWLMIGTNWQI